MAAERVEGGRAVVPTAATRAQGRRPAARSSRTAASSSVEAQGVVVVGLEKAQIAGAEAGEVRRFGHRAVRLV